MTFQANPPVGALQVSAARKDNGPVSDEDLRDFAELAPNADLSEVNFGDFHGITTEKCDDGLRSHEWWLRSDDLLVYVTYNVGEEAGRKEEEEVAAILRSLQMRR